MRRFPQLIIVRHVIRFSSSGGASSDRSRPPSWRPRRVPHHLILLISLAQSPQSHHGWRRVSVILFKQATRLWHPSHHGASRLGSSSHPIPIMKRLASSSRPMRLANHLERIPPPRINEGRVMTKQANEHERTGRPGRETGSKTGRGRNEHNKTTERENGTRTDGKQAGRRQRGHATQSRTRTMPLIILARPPLPGSRRLAGLNQSPAPGAWDETGENKLASRPAGVPHLIGYRVLVRAFPHRRCCHRRSYRLSKKLG